MRRIKPNLFIRIINGWKAGLSTIVFITAILGFILMLVLENRISTLLIIAFILLVIVSGLIASYIRGKQKLLPDIIFDELSAENRYIVDFCTQNSLFEADEMTKPYFGKNFIPFDRIEQWRLKNSKGFVHLVNSDNVLCACFVIIGLDKSFFDQFIVGRVTEKDIESDVVLSFEEVKKQNRVYISGVVVRDPGSYIGAKRTRAMLWTMLDYIKNVFTLRKTREFYAVGLTIESEKLLKAMGFKIIGSKNKRKDECNMYKIDLDKNTWTRLLCRVGDYSNMVEVQYSI